MKTLITTAAIALISTVATAEVTHKNFNGANATANADNGITQQWTNDAAWHWNKLTEHANIDGTHPDWHQYRWDLATQVWNKGIQGAGISVGIVDDFVNEDPLDQHLKAQGHATTHGGVVSRTAKLFAPKSTVSEYNWDSKAANTNEQSRNALAAAVNAGNDIINLSFSTVDTHGRTTNKLEEIIKDSKALFIVAAGNQGRECAGFGTETETIGGTYTYSYDVGTCNAIGSVITGSYQNTTGLKEVRLWQPAVELADGTWQSGYNYTGYEVVDAAATGWTREAGVDNTQGIIAGALRDGVIAEYSNWAGHAHALDTLFAEVGEGYISGTSLAAPIISGAAALVMDKFNTNAWATKQILFQTATDLGAPGVDKVYGRGALNIAGALSPVGVTW